MGHISIDLSLENVRRQDAILVRDARPADPLPPGELDHYWRVVEAYRQHDIEVTGNAHRFDHDHPWVAKEFGVIEHKLLLAEMSEPPVPPVVHPETAAVPEPVGWMQLGVLIAMTWILLIIARKVTPIEQDEVDEPEPSKRRRTLS